MILLVEDSPDDEALMVRALEQSSSAGVTVMRDGADAVAWLLSVGGPPFPELVLLDMNLPRVKGIDVLRRIRTLPHLRHVPVVMLTSSAHADEVARSYESGANSCVSKPSDPDRLAQAIRGIARYWLELNSPVVPP